jgi:hypothetical protein
MSSSAWYVLHAGFLLDLAFSTEEGGDLFLRNIEELSLNYTPLYSRGKKRFETITAKITN